MSFAAAIVAAIRRFFTTLDPACTQPSHPSLERGQRLAAECGTFRRLYDPDLYADLMRRRREANAEVARIDAALKDLDRLRALETQT